MEDFNESTPGMLLMFVVLLGILLVGAIIIYGLGMAIEFLITSFSVNPLATILFLSVLYVIFEFGRQMTRKQEQD